MHVYIKHYLGLYNFKDQVQRCVLCGEIIHDYRGGSFAANTDGSFPINNGWMEGDHYVSQQTNPTIYLTSPNPDDIIIKCLTPMLMASMEERKNAAIIEGIKVHQDIADKLYNNKKDKIKELTNKTMNKQFAIGINMIAFVAMTKGQAIDEGVYTGTKNLIPSQEEDERSQEGYLVDYGNYKSWSPKDVFDNAYFPIEDPTKISKSDVEGFIVKGDSTKLGEKTTVVLDSTITGFDTLGTSACVDPANYDQEISNEIARRDITNKIWGHLGFVLQWAKNGLKAKANS